MGGRQGASSLPASVGQRFAEERERLGLSRAELAHAAGYSAEQIRKVEIGERMPGGELLAALLDIGGDLVAVLKGASGVRDAGDSSYPTADELYEARLREQIRAEARAHSRMRADRRKKVLTDEEADLVEAYRELSKLQREQALAAVRALQAGMSIGGDGTTVVSSGPGSRAAGRDIIEKGRGRKRET